MKKRISLLLAIVMLFSSVAVFAAPEVEYMFYDEDDHAYGVFGKYTNGNISGINYFPADDAGVYVGSQKFSYAEFIEDYARENEGKFAFELTTNSVPSKNLLVQPYTHDEFGEDLGLAREYDYTTNSLKEESSNALLSSLSLTRANNGKGTVYQTALVMYPEFDPEVEDYTLVGQFGSGNQPLSNLVIQFTTQDPDADAELVHDGWYGTTAGLDAKGNNGYGSAKTAKIIVTSADGSATKTYNITVRSSLIEFVSSGKSASVPLNSVPTYYEKNLDGTIKSNGNIPTNVDVLAYDLRDPATYDGKTYTSRYVIFKANLTDGIKAAVNEGRNVALGIDATLKVGNYKNIKVAAKAVNANKSLGNTYSTHTLIDPAAISSDNRVFFSLCVTDLIKDTLAKNPTATEVEVGVEIVDIEVPVNATADTSYLPAFRFTKGTDISTGRGTGLFVEIKN